MTSKARSFSIGGSTSNNITTTNNATTNNSTTNNGNSVDTTLKHNFEKCKIEHYSICHKCENQIIGINLSHQCTNCFSFFHSRCVNEIINKKLDNTCLGPPKVKKIWKIALLPSLFKSIFSKSASSVILGYSQQLLDEKTFKKDQIQIWIELMRVDDDKYVYHPKYYDLFDNLKLSEELFSYLFNMIIGSDVNISLINLDFPETLSPIYSNTLNKEINNIQQHFKDKEFNNSNSNSNSNSNNNSTVLNNINSNNSNNNSSTLNQSQITTNSNNNNQNSLDIPFSPKSMFSSLELSGNSSYNGDMDEYINTINSSSSYNPNNMNHMINNSSNTNNVPENFETLRSVSYYSNFSNSTRVTNNSTVNENISPRSYSSTPSVITSTTTTTTTNNNNSNNESLKNNKKNRNNKNNSKIKTLKRVPTIIINKRIKSQKNKISQSYLISDQYKWCSQMIALNILYRAMFNENNVIHFLNDNYMVPLGMLYQIFIERLKNATLEDDIKILQINSKLLLSILFRLLDFEILLPLFFTNKIIESILKINNEKSKLLNKIGKDEQEIFDKVVLLIGKYFHLEPYHSLIERRPEWLDMIINYSMTYKVGILHKEINPGEVIKYNEIYDSPLCSVYRGTYNGMDVAIKEFSQDGLAFDWRSIYREITISCSIQHPKVVKVYGAHTIKTKKPFIVTELCSRGSLMTAIREIITSTGKPPSIPLLINMAVDAAQSLEFIHSKNIIHRDVKTDNFLVNSNWEVKLIDFGVSRFVETEILNMTLVGTPVYMSEEVLAGKQYQHPTDVYSFGIVLWEMFTQQTPFDNMSRVEHFAFIQGGGRPHIPDNLPPKISMLIQDCWQSDPDRRPTFRQVLNILYSLVSPSPNSPDHHHLVPVVSRLLDSSIIQLQILKHLDTNSLLNCALTSHQFRCNLFNGITIDKSSFKDYWIKLLSYSKESFRILIDNNNSSNGNSSNNNSGNNNNNIKNNSNYKNINNNNQINNNSIYGSPIQIIYPFSPSVQSPQIHSENYIYPTSLISNPLNSISNNISSIDKSDSDSSSNINNINNSSLFINSNNNSLSNSINQSLNNNQLLNSNSDNNNNNNIEVVNDFDNTKIYINLDNSNIQEKDHQEKNNSSSNSSNNFEEKEDELNEDESSSNDISDTESEEYHSIKRSYSRLPQINEPSIAPSVSLSISQQYQNGKLSYQTSPAISAISPLIKGLSPQMLSPISLSNNSCNSCNIYENTSACD